MWEAERSQAGTWDTEYCEKEVCLILHFVFEIIT